LHYFLFKTSDLGNTPSTFDIGSLEDSAVIDAPLAQLRIATFRSEYTFSNL
jgi:hypothetical protein